MFARGSLGWITSAFLLFIISLIFAFFPEMSGTETELQYTMGFFLLIISSMMFLFLWIFFVIFFRDPDRNPVEGIVAPADGVVKDIRKEDHGGREHVRIVTFMNVHNVHVNRIPVDGTILSITRHNGKFLPAYKDESIHNNRVETVLKTRIGQLIIFQITGIFARRIEVYLSEKDSVKKGRRLGMIRFGSRVDLLIPAKKVKVTVTVGEKVKANLTKLAEIRK